jgi:ribosomal protein L11 methyltransferase
VVIQALFIESERAEAVSHILTTHLPHLNHQTKPLPEERWEKACLVDFKPLRYGKRLWICPSWHTPPEPDAVNLMLDPGLAFGTGSHPTTALCLEWLDGTNLADKTVIDYGCGSGILALAALKLGASRTYGVDIDAQALLATQNNAKKNRIHEQQLTVHFPEDLSAETPKADVLLANILLKPLLELNDRFLSLLNPTGELIVSGILEEQVPEVTKAYASNFEPIQTLFKDGWALVVFHPRFS